jgi:signal transduction histidine kinase
MINPSSPVQNNARSNWAAVTRRLAPVLVVIYQLLAIIAFLSIAFYGISYSQIPFLGAMTEHTLLISGSDSVTNESWQLRSQGVGFGYQLRAIDGRAVSSVRELNEILLTYRVGDEVALSLLPPDQSEPRTIGVELRPFPLADLIAQLVVPYLIGLIYLGSGLWVFVLRRYDRAGQVFATFTAAVAMAVAGLFEIGSTAQLTSLWSISVALIGGTMLHLAFLFPQETRWVQRRPLLGLLSYLPTVALAAWGFPALFNYSDPFAYVLPWRYSYVFAGVASLFFVAVGVFRRYRATSPIIRQQGQIILWGALISFLPISVWFFITANRPEIRFSPYLLFPLAAFPIAVAYAILRYRLINTDYVFSRAVLYAVLTVIAVSGYALVVAGFSLVFGERLPATNPFVVGLMIFIFAVLLDPAKDRLQTAVDRVFFRGQRAYQERVQAFSRELNPAMDLASIVALLRRYFEESLMPTQLHIFILDSLHDSYIASESGRGRPSTDIRFSSSSALPQILSRSGQFIHLGEGSQLPAALETDRARLALLNAQLFIPLPGHSQQAIGFIALGPRKSGEPYTNLDMNLLLSLADQAALAIERAQVVADLERRVQEMNVLTRVAQGINVTLIFDDILELIYAQVNRLIPTRDFWIMLYNRENDFFHYVFYLEDDKRLLQHENRPIFSDQGLTQVVIRLGRPLVTDDYERECRARGITPQVKSLYGWVGVPLNAAAETIGGISLGSRDTSVVYSEEQLELLKAIADQAAGAIVKARLLEDSERAARQLALLNEVGRNLTAMLDLPNLLNQILDSAMEILNTEAGTLFLVDEETGELVFEVVAGPVANELVGQRLPPGTGHVGRAVETGKPAIVNQARRTLEWSEKPDEKTGFRTRDLLLAPMFVKERVIGVLEVINRQDGLPFTKEDQELLQTFTSQTAVALENARLYTLTDQQLAARVDELSVMQRIDRELNASLDVNRAMRITLDWALRQSGADAGLVGTVEESGVRVIVERGYTSELAPYQNSLLPLELPGLKGAVENEQTQQFHRSILEEAAPKDGFSLLQDAAGQLVIPIRREGKVIGILLLESRQQEPWNEDTQAFLSRLSDHAAIAIANAQLFAQVQAADLAKSEFVSFVSHELKTPMTSIRGYTDLLLGGVVGPVNETQQDFLGTIRSNVTRMATLVSDLADVSRIEAGRLRLDFQAVRVADVVEDVARSQKRDIEEKGQTLTTLIPAELPPVWGDRIRLIQVLTNLVSNAYKYTPQGGHITIVAERTPNRWDPSGAPDVVRVAVADDGLGMTLEDQEKLFTKFFRSEDPEARQSPGTGLGLNITRYLVEMQGGKIWFESVYRQGTTFYFTVPVAEV